MRLPVIVVCLIFIHGSSCLLGFGKLRDVKLQRRRLAGERLRGLLFRKEAGSVDRGVNLQSRASIPNTPAPVTNINIQNIYHNRKNNVVREDTNIGSHNSNIINNDIDINEKNTNLINNRNDNINILENQVVNNGYSYPVQSRKKRETQSTPTYTYESLPRSRFTYVHKTQKLPEPEPEPEPELEHVEIEEVHHHSAEEHHSEEEHEELHEEHISTRFSRRRSGRRNSSRRSSRRRLSRRERRRQRRRERRREMRREQRREQRREERRMIRNQLRQSTSRNSTMAVEETLRRRNRTRVREPSNASRENRNNTNSGNFERTRNGIEINPSHLITETHLHESEEHDIIDELHETEEHRIRRIGRTRPPVPARPPPSAVPRVPQTDQVTKLKRTRVPVGRIPTHPEKFEHGPVLVEYPSQVIVGHPEHVVVENPGHVVVEHPRHVIAEHPGHVVVEHPRHVVAEHPGHVVVEHPRHVIAKHPGPVIAKHPGPVIAKHPELGIAGHPGPVFEHRANLPIPHSVNLNGPVVHQRVIPVPQQRPGLEVVKVKQPPAVVHHPIPAVKSLNSAPMVAQGPPHIMIQKSFPNVGKVTETHLHESEEHDIIDELHETEEHRIRRIGRTRPPVPARPGTQSIFQAPRPAIRVIKPKPPTLQVIHSAPPLKNAPMPLPTIVHKPVLVHNPSHQDVSSNVVLPASPKIIRVPKRKRPVQVLNVPAPSPILVQHVPPVAPLLIKNRAPKVEQYPRQLIFPNPAPVKVANVSPVVVKFPQSQKPKIHYGMPASSTSFIHQPLPLVVPNRTPILAQHTSVVKPVPASAPVAVAHVPKPEKRFPRRNRSRVKVVNLPGPTTTIVHPAVPVPQISTVVHRQVPIVYHEPIIVHNPHMLVKNRAPVVIKQEPQSLIRVPKLGPKVVNVPAPVFQYPAPIQKVPVVVKKRARIAKHAAIAVPQPFAHTLVQNADHFHIGTDIQEHVEVTSLRKKNRRIKWEMPVTNAYGQVEYLSFGNRAGDVHLVPTRSRGGGIEYLYPVTDELGISHNLHWKTSSGHLSLVEASYHNGERWTGIIGYDNTGEYIVPVHFDQGHHLMVENHAHRLQYAVDVHPAYDIISEVYHHKK